jgi:predicted flavoprotein YhiN
MAAEVLAAGGARVDLFDAMPSVGRKLLLAGRGGLNLTHSEPLPAFLSRYAGAQDALTPMIDAFGPQALRDWAQDLGIATFVGTSGRVFPSDLKAAPLLRAWLHRLRGAGVAFHTRARWQGWSADGSLCFAGPAGCTRLTQPCSRSAARAGPGWARTPLGSACSDRAASRLPRSNPPIAALMWHRRSAAAPAGAIS